MLNFNNEDKAIMNTKPSMSQISQQRSDFEEQAKDETATIICDCDETSGTQMQGI